MVNLQHALAVLGFIALLPINAAMGNDSTEQSFSLGSQSVPVNVPEGFELSLLTTDMSGPRVIHRHDNLLLIGSKSGSVYQLEPPYTTPVEVAQLSDYPHSVVVFDDHLYVAHTSGVIRTPWPIDDRQDQWPLSNADFKPVVKLPGGRGHNSRTLKLGPDGRLYVSLGITGNCSNEYLDGSYPWNDRRGGVFVLNENPDAATDASALTHTIAPFASGLRNPVGFDWHPETGVMYASNNGPDHSGYELPRESFAKLTENSFHGMPWFQWEGDELTQDTCIKQSSPRPASDVQQPVTTFPARIAPMDVGFVKTTEGSAWSTFNNDAIVALHGSWATSDGTGRGDPATRREPMIVRVEFDESGESTGVVHSFIDGFQLDNGARWARPMGIAFAEDGSLLFTSDGGVEGLFQLKAIAQ